MSQPSEGPTRTAVGRRSRPASRDSVSSSLNSERSAVTTSSIRSQEGQFLPRTAARRRTRAVSHNQLDDSSSETSTPQISSRSAPEMRASPKGCLPSYNAHTAARLLRAERESRLKSQFWPWKQATTRPRIEGRADARDAPARIHRMRATYLDGAAAAARELTATVGDHPRTSPAEPCGARESATVNHVAHFDLTDEQINCVAKYFGGDFNMLQQAAPLVEAATFHDEVPTQCQEACSPIARLTSSRRPSSSTSTAADDINAATKSKGARSPLPKTPSVCKDTVDDLLHWAQNLDGVLTP